MYARPPDAIVRYVYGERAAHWLLALFFFLAGLSGLAFFHPSMFWLTNLFGGGPWTKILHPFLGIAMAVFFFALAARVLHHNMIDHGDIEWLKKAHLVLAGHEEGIPPAGRYNAGLYDPKGVGGTHVMYVLKHADKPELYHGLPADPHISPMVALWKGVMKPIALAAMAFTVVGSFLHYVKVGPKDPGEAPVEPEPPSRVV